MAAITNHKSFEKWLGGKPAAWSAAMALRIALRVMPMVGNPAHFMGGTAHLRLTASVFRCGVLSWVAGHSRTQDSALAAARAAFAADAAAGAARAAADAAALAADTSRAAADAADAAALAADAATDAAAAAANAAARAAAGAAAIWDSIDSDCQFLDRLDASETGARASAQRLLALPLWTAAQPAWFAQEYAAMKAGLTKAGQGFGLWLGWYARRVRGEAQGFALPPEQDGEISRRLVAADNGWWQRKPALVNADIQAWLDELTPKEPGQEAGATAYGVNAAGKLDRLPPADQQHLHDAPDQQQIYNDVRNVLLDLQSEGQRLGPRLEKAAGQMLSSMPERFVDAQAYPIWRDGNALRRISYAHRSVADGRDYDDKRLEPPIAEMLGGVLDLYNLFAFGDAGLRAKDEAAVPPQERVKAQREADFAKPIADAIFAAPQIATETALNDIKAEREAIELPADDPYADQVLDQSNRTTRNWVAGLLRGAGQAIRSQLAVSAKNARDGAERAVGALVVSEIVGVSNIHGPIVEFVVRNASVLKNYAETAYANISLQWLWDLIARIH